MVLSLSFLATPRIQFEQETIPLRRRKAVALLAYLAVTNQPHTRERLAALLWPEHDDARALAYLRNTLWIITGHIGKSFVQADDLTVALRAAAGVEVDVLRFRSLLGSATPGIDALQAAVALYQDEFLAGFSLRDAPAFDEWQTIECEALHRQFIGAIAQLTSLLKDRGDTEAALEVAERWARVDPLDENAQTMLIDLCLQTGRPALARQRFEAYGDLLRREFAAEPSPALAERIQSAGMVNISQSATLPGFPIPVPATAFVGRKRESAEVIALLQRPDCRLLTLTGIGGIGKTRLALHVAAQLAGSFAHGVAFIPLIELQTPDYVLPTIAINMGCVLEEDADHEVQLIDYVRDRHMLLLLDNYEHLLETAPLISRILQHAPQTVVLVTSTEVLRLSCEWVYPLDGLAQRSPAADENEALELFGARARQVRGGAALRPDEVPAAEHICQILGGMPLALELAASWLMALTVDDIVAILEHSPKALATTARDVPPRHRSLWAVFSHSWDGLPPHQQRHYAQLSVFCRPFMVRAAHRVTGASAHDLGEYVAKSLLDTDDGRFSMHPLLQGFARIKLEEDSELLRTTCDKHSAYYASLTSDALPEEMLEICAALDWANQRANLDRICRLTRLLRDFYTTWGWHIATESTYRLLRESSRLAQEHDHESLTVMLHECLDRLYRFN